MFLDITAHSRQHGSDQNILCTGFDEECERELEHERSIEKEEEEQLPLQKPHVQEDWPFATLLEVRTPAELPANANIQSLSDTMQTRFASTNLSEVYWSMCNIFVTRNFTETVASTMEGEIANISDFLRPVDAIVLFESNDSCLLLSEWEADKTIELFWGIDEEKAVMPRFTNLTYLLEAISAHTEDVPKLQLPYSTSRRQKGNGNMVHLSEHTLGGLQLLAGHTMFSSEARRGAVADLLPTPEAKKAALDLVVLRGEGHMISRSDLEEICSHGMEAH